MKKTAFIMIGDNTLCEWLGLPAFDDRRAKFKEITGQDLLCGYDSVTEAKAAARIIRPFFRPGLVKVKTGSCPN